MKSTRWLVWAVLALVCTGCCKSDEQMEAERAAAASAAAQRAAARAELPKPVTLVSEDKTSTHVAVFASEVECSVAFGYFANDDMLKLTKLMKKGCKTPKEAKATLLKLTSGKTADKCGQVRINSGPCKGRTGWTFYMWINPRPSA